MLEYVFLVYTEFDKTYVGNFESCEQIDQYVESCYTLPSEQWSTACIHQDYLYLPANFVPVYPDMDCSKD